MPGLTMCRRCMSKPYFSASAGSAGRGPTSDISPRATLISCGSSSSDQRRSQPPTRVMRGSRRILNSIPPADSFSSARRALCASASTTMVRNFHTWKVPPFLPTRVCLKNTGPWSVTRMATAMTANAGASASRASPAAARSRPPLMIRLTPPSSAWSTCSSGSPATGRIVVRGPATSSRAGATYRSVPVVSRSQPSWRSRVPSISGQESTATVSALKWSTASGIVLSPPNTGTLPTALPTVDGRPEPARQAPTTDMPWWLLRRSVAVSSATAGAWPTTTTRRRHWPAWRTLCRCLRSQ